MSDQGPETDEEQLLDEYIEDVSRFPEPTKAQWQALMLRWRGTGVNIESLLVIGGAKGWIRF